MNPETLPWWTEQNKKFAVEVEEFVNSELRPLADKIDHNQAMEVQWEISKFVVDKGWKPSGKIL